MRKIFNIILFKLYSFYKAKKIRFKNDYLRYRLRNESDISPDFQIDDYGSVMIANGYLKIGRSVFFRKYCSVYLYKGGRLEIGNNVFFNNYCAINCLDSIIIGENTIFGEGVKLYDHNHFISRDTIIKIERDRFATSAIKIGQNCWIGSNVTILRGVTIGDNVVVGANCLIYKSIPNNSIVKHNEALIVN